MYLSKPLVSHVNPNPSKLKSGQMTDTSSPSPSNLAIYSALYQDDAHLDKFGKLKISKEKRARSHRRIRAKISGTEQRPRLSIFKSNNHIYTQAIDDENQKTLVSSSDLEIKDVKSKKLDKSTLVAKKLAEKLKSKNSHTTTQDV